VAVSHRLNKSAGVAKIEQGQSEEAISADTIGGTKVLQQRMGFRLRQKFVNEGEESENLVLMPELAHRKRSHTLCRIVVANFWHCTLATINDVIGLRITKTALSPDVS
jgi:hypothetical protein